MTITRSLSRAVTAGHHESVLRSHRWRTVENSAAHLLPYLRPGHRLLDVGCGPGTITTDFATRVSPGRVLGIDTSPDAIDVARRDHPEVEFALGDVYTLQYDDGSWDIVHAHQLLQHLTDPAAALNEMRRVVRPDGIVAARDSDYATFTWYPADARLTRWLALYQEIARANGGEPDAGRRLLSWAQQAGFSRVAPSASVWCVESPEDRAWWGGLWADRMTSSAIAQQALRERRATAGDLEHKPACHRSQRPVRSSGRLSFLLSSNRHESSDTRNRLSTRLRLRRKAHGLSSTTMARSPCSISGRFDPPWRIPRQIQRS